MSGDECTTKVKRVAEYVIIINEVVFVGQYTFTIVNSMNNDCQVQR